MVFMSEKIGISLKAAGLRTRPNAGPGWWIMFLLPISIIISYVRNPEIASEQYKYVTLTVTGFAISNFILLHCSVKRNDFKVTLPHILTAIYTSSLFYMCLRKGIVFSILSGFFTVFAYVKGLPGLLRTCPMSFSFGEASLVLQGLVIFIYIAIVNIVRSLNDTPTKICHVTNIILQVGISGILALCFIVYKFRYFRRTIQFYALTGIIIFGWILGPLHVVLRRSPILWIFEMLTKDFDTIKILIFWIICTILAIIFLNRQIQTGKKANTMLRKIFHVLAVLVYLPGLIDQCTILYLATGIVLAIFIILEILRVLNLPPLGRILQDGFTIFSDDKDLGGIAWTPIYLLVGCSVPIWIHPEPCDVTDSAGFNLLPLISGLLSVGIGDTCASVFGMLLGRHQWTGSQKTLEGTMTCILGQLGLIFGLMHFGFILGSNENIIRSLCAVLVSSFVEAKTDQVDNIVLPFLNYIFLV